MKHLGKIEIGGSLDITNNKHVEDLIEEAIQGIEFPEDTNTTYTLTQDGLTVQLVDDGGQVVSEIEIPEHENTTYTLIQDGTTIRLVDNNYRVVSQIEIPQPVDPYQEVKGIATPTVSLFEVLRSESYDGFDLTTEYDAENERISIYLHLHIGDTVKTFTLADNVNNTFDRYHQSIGTMMDSKTLIEISENQYNGILRWYEEPGKLFSLFDPKVLPASDVNANLNDGAVIAYSNFYIHIPGTNESTASDQDVIPATITGTLEEHLEKIYEYIHHLYN